MEAPRQSFRFPWSHRLHGRSAFAAVYAGKMRKPAGPLSLSGIPNDCGHWRVGISIGRRCGTAVQRNAIKRLIREAYRLTQHDWPGGYDAVVVVHPHPRLSLGEYQRLLLEAAVQIDSGWRRRQSRRNPQGEGA